MSERDDHESVGMLKVPIRHGGDEKRRDFRLMGFAASLALLVMLATPWLTTWDDDAEKPTRVYSGIGLIELQYGVDGPDSPLRGWGTLLFVGYLLLALVCLVFPATIGAVVCSCAGFVVTLGIIIVKPESYSAAPGTAANVEHVDWTGASTVAVGIWLVAVVVSVAGWSAPQDEVAHP